MSSLDSKPLKTFKGHMIGVLKEKLTIQENIEFETLIETIFSTKKEPFEKKDVIFRLGKESLFGEGILCSKNKSEGIYNLELIGSIERPPKSGNPIVYRILESKWKEYPQDLFESLNYNIWAVVEISGNRIQGDQGQVLLHYLNGESLVEIEIKGDSIETLSETFQYIQELTQRFVNFKEYSELFYLTRKN